MSTKLATDPIGEEKIKNQLQFMPVTISSNSTATPCHTRNQQQLLIHTQQNINYNEPSKQLQFSI